MSTYQFNEEEARAFDQADPLANFRDEFYINENWLYFDGNSLGLASKRAEASLLHALNDWKQLGIEGWTQGERPWFYFSEQLGEKVAHLVGAAPKEVIATGSTTSNLHQMVASFYRPDGKRTKILADALAFPTDIYVLKSQLALHGLDPAEHLILVGDADIPTLNEEDLIEAMTDEVALVLLPSILYRSGQLLDIERLTTAAHKAGAVIGFDLCHSIGAVPHQLHDWSVDFAVWCHYKYLNSGPGASGGLFVHETHHGKVKPGLQGWFGSDKMKQFDMALNFTPGEGAGAFQMGTPHIFSLAPLVGSLELMHEAGIERVREKSLKQTNYLLALIDHTLQGYGFEVSTPRVDSQRGGHVSLEHPEAARICKALKAEGVIPDFRAPNGIRLAPIALYTRYLDSWQMVITLKTIMDTEAYKKFENTRDVVA